MDFTGYRESLSQVQKLADRFSSLNRTELSELNRVNEKCLSMHGEMVGCFNTAVNRIEDQLTLLLDRLDLLKKDLARVSGPEGTLGDILRLEPQWFHINALRNNINELLGPKAGDMNAPLEPEAKEKAAEAGNGNSGKELSAVQDLIGLARQEAAAAVAECRIEAKPLPPAVISQSVKIQKKEVPDSRPQAGKKPVSLGTAAKNEAVRKDPPKKEQKNPPPAQNSPKQLPLAVGKSYGDAEKKLMEELTKNIEIIKKEKKRG